STLRRLCESGAKCSAPRRFAASRDSSVGRYRLSTAVRTKSCAKANRPERFINTASAASHNGDHQALRAIRIDLPLLPANVCSQPEPFERSRTECQFAFCFLVRSSAELGGVVDAIWPGAPQRLLFRDGSRHGRANEFCKRGKPHGLCNRLI